jgi:protein gp37
MSNKMSNSGIDYADKAANTMYGCKHGCPYCYMESKVMPRLKGRVVDKDFQWTVPEYHYQDISKMRRRFRAQSKNPNLPIGEMMVAVNFTGDMFGEWVPNHYIEKVLDNIPTYNCYLFLTKNPKRYADFLGMFGWNYWLGTTIVSKDDYERFRTFLLSTRKENFLPHRWVSFEPLLGSIGNGLKYIRQLEWVVVGACTGPLGFQPEKAWVQEIMDECFKWKVPLFIKDNVKAPEFQHFKMFPKV